MLCDQIGNKTIKELFMSPSEFHPFPKYRERAAWDTVKAETRDKWVSEAEKAVDYAWPATPMYVYRIYGTEGNFYPHWLAFTEKRAALGIFLIAECLEGKGRFIQQIINGIYAVCELTIWSPPIDRFVPDQGIPDEDFLIVDLATSETAALLAWTYYFMKDELDEISTRICRRIHREVERRVIKPYTAIDDYWWMGFAPDRMNNWNPWCNMNVLMSHLVIDFGEDEREKGLKRLAKSLDLYHGAYSEDGGCDEGPMYWGAAGGGFNICLELLRDATRGALNVFDDEKVKRMGTYLYKAFIDGTYYVCYADGDAIVPLPPSVFTYGKNINDPLLTQLGASAPAKKIEWQNWFYVYQYVQDIFTEDERIAARSNTPPYVKDAWLDTIKMMAAREHEGSAKGLYLSAKAGHNAESHNHNDIGNFIVYCNGKPMLIDFGTEEYRAQTFSARRFELWYLQSQYHNCPTVNGVMQCDGRDFYAENAAYSCGEASGMTMDITHAYPAEAGIEQWNRTIGLMRGGNAKVELVDEFALAQESMVDYNFVTLFEPNVTEGGIAIGTDGATVLLTYDKEALSVIIEKIELTDIRLQRNWGAKAYRIVLSERDKTKQAKRVFSITEA